MARSDAVRVSADRSGVEIEAAGTLVRSPGPLFEGEAKKQAIDCDECKGGIDFGVPRAQWSVSESPDLRFVKLQVVSLSDERERMAFEVKLPREVGRPTAMARTRRHPPLAGPGRPSDR